MTIGAEEIKEVHIGDMGVKEVISNGQTIYERTGSYIYLQLISNKKENK